jgi:hypothetical protein
MQKKEGRQMKINSEKPSILCALAPVGQKQIPADLKEVLYGIEEEQIPYKLTRMADDDTIKRAYDAAEASRLSVGLAYDPQKIVVHYKNMDADKPLFVVKRTEGQTVLRQLGNNAARLVKGIPFKDNEQ